MPQERPLPFFDDRTVPDRYCDLILTGGVTSAVAYPPAIFALASVYRLHSIGGTSSGAGAAALAAAAEYRRRHGGSDGFQCLLERTAEVADLQQGRVRLSWLFQPEARKQRLFDAVAPGFAAARGMGPRLLRGLLGSYAAAPLLAFVLVALAGVALAAWIASPTWAVQLVLLAFGALALIAAGVAWVIAIWLDFRHVVDDDFGLCSGIAETGSDHPPPFTDWLHELIQEVAALPKDRPLTFGDLARAPGAPKDTFGGGEPRDAQSIRLQMYAANVTYGRPIVLPHDVGDAASGHPPFCFRVSEMEKLFPPEVVKHLSDHGQALPRGSAIFEPPLADDDGDDVLRILPTAELPVLVAVRMSVSFPILFSAVPLWVLDDGDGPVAVYRRCLIADGGLCSGFPIHLFDSPIPEWPTFGISMVDLPDRPGMEQQTLDEQKAMMLRAIELPQRHTERTKRYLHTFDDPDRGGLWRFGAYVWAIFSTIRHWTEELLVEQPGVRDRVVRLGLAPGIGGLNILMSGEQIRCLAEVGGEAAKRLLERYARPANAAGVAQGWSEHRWVRFNLLKGCLQDYLAGLATSAAGGRFAQPLAQQIREAVQAAPLAGEAPLQPAQAAALEGALAALLEAERLFGAASAIEQPYQPSPRPNLRIRPSR